MFFQQLLPNFHQMEKESHQVVQWLLLPSPILTLPSWILDEQGNVRVWAVNCLEAEKSIFEKKILSGKVSDLCWDTEGKRLFVVGKGAFAINLETGTSLGDLSFHSKSVNSVTVSPVKPLQVMTCSDDYRVALFGGRPVRLEHSFTSHSNFVHQIAYSPCGKYSASVGSDKSVLKLQQCNNLKTLRSFCIQMKKYQRPLKMFTLAQYLDCLG